MDKTIDKLLENNPIIYHYTSIRSLYWILQSNQIWLSKASAVNDKSERVDFIEKLKNELLPKISKTSFDTVFSKVDTQNFEKVPYIMSFSKLKDDAAQWERYAAAAKGVCIFFNSKLLYEATKNLNRQPLFEINYDYNVKENEIYKIILSNDANHISLDYYNYLVLLESIKHKHSSFQAEQEIRLKIEPDSTSFYKQFNCQESLEFKNETIRKILKMNIDLKNIIEGAIIGPKSEQTIIELSEYARMLGFEKLSKNITLSDCPLR